MICRACAERPELLNSRTSGFCVPRAPSALVLSLRRLRGPSGSGDENGNSIAARPRARNTAAKRLRMRQVEHFRSLFLVTLSSQSLPRASFCVQLVVQLFCFMLLVFLTIL